jgi:hypothetical protein
LGVGLFSAKNQIDPGLFQLNRVCQQESDPTQEGEKTAMRPGMKNSIPHY